jgi:zinc transport system permease protein
MFEILNYDFMRNAYIVWFCLAILWPIIWAFLIMRRYTMISDTISHISLTWVMLWLISSYSPILVTLVYTIFSTIIIEKLRLTKRLTGDMVLSLLLGLNLAIVSLLISLNNRFMLNISSYLFWSIALVSRFDVVVIWVLSILVLIVLFIIRKPLLKITYDEDNAKAVWINVKLINLIFIIIVATIITLAIPITWVLLISSLIVLPIIASTQISSSFKSTIIISEVISLISVFSWITLSYYFDISTSSIITFFLIWFFVIFFGIRYFKSIDLK